MNDADFQAAIVAALQPIATQAGRAVNYTFSPVGTEVSGTVNP